MHNCKPVSTPLSVSEELSAYDGDSLGPKDSTIYRSIVGALHYSILQCNHKPAVQLMVSTADKPVDADLL